MAANVQFVLDADEAKAVNAFLKLNNAQKKSESQFAKTTRKAKQFDKTVSKVGRSLKGLVFGLAGAGGVAASLRGLISGVSEASRRLVEFDTALTPLLGLGDNVDNVDAVRKSVLNMSGAWGIARNEIATAMFDLQSGTANLAKAQQQQLLTSSLELTKVYGGELPTNLKALVKTFQIYRDTIGDVNIVQGRLAFLGEQGFLTFQEMANLLPDVLPAAKAFGFSLDEVVAALVVATQVGGKTEKTFTGMRNVFLRLSEAQKHGITLTGSFANQLEQLNTTADPDLIKKIFGAEAFTVTTNLINATKQYREVLADLEGGVESVGEKINRRLNDPTSKLAETLRIISEIQKNLIAGGNEFTETTGGLLTQFQAIKTARLAALPEAIRIPGLAGFLAGGQQFGQFLAPQVFGRKAREAEDIGLTLFEAELRRGGRTERADEVSEQRERGANAELVLRPATTALMGVADLLRAVLQKRNALVE